MKRQPIVSHQRKIKISENGAFRQPFDYSSHPEPHATTSSSCSSSVSELPEFNYYDEPNLDSLTYLAPEPPTPAPRFTLGKVKKSRKQHTLNSIGSEKSRSRSPIVARFDMPEAKKPLGSVNESDNESSTVFVPPSRSVLSTNPFESGTNHVAHTSPIERISLQSFEWRRSEIEADRPRRADVAPLAQADANVAASCLSDRDGSDNLSLDHILAEIQSDKSPSDQVSKREANLTSAATIEANHVTAKITDTDTEHSLKPARQDSESQLLTSLSISSQLSASSGSIVSTPRWPRKVSDVASGEHESENGFEIVWLNFTYSVEPSILEDPRWGKINSLFHKESRTILKGLSGGLKSGQMVALMGPSGAGKTCLLECISGVRLTGIGGQIYLRGRKRAQLMIVPQFDDFMPQFTVEETITYGSKMKNPANSDHKAITDHVIEQLGLEVCRYNNIQKCSGGQRKRVAIAQELVSQPNILILDEPTSGLDSSCCYQTMKVLRDVLDRSVNSKQPMAIITTIHQPSAKVFKMFDLVYLLGKTGYIAYSGPPDDLVHTIRDVTGLECPQYSNPSDYMIELVSYDYGEEPVERLIEFEKDKAKQFVKDYEARAQIKVGELDEKANGAIKKDDFKLRVTKLADSKQELSNGSTSLILAASAVSKLKPSKSDTYLNFNESPDGISMRFKARELLRTNQQHVHYKLNVSTPLRKATSSSNNSHPFFWHTFVHFHRSFLQSIRDPILNNMRILIHLGFATLLVLLFGQKSGEARGCPPILGLPTEITDPHNESMIDLADNVGYLFMCIMMITYVSLMSTVLTFPIDIKTVGKEYKNGWYGTITYFLGKTMADLPFIIVYPVVYCLITWFVTHQAQDHGWRFLSFTSLIIMNAMNSQSFGLILGALFVNSVTAATFLGPVITIPWYLFTGFTKRVHRLSAPYRATSKFLFTRYIFEGLLDTVYGHQRCNCSQFLQQYYELRYEEAVRLGQLISAETLSSLDYYDGLETVTQDFHNKTELFLSEQTGKQWFEKTVDAASSVFADGEDLNLASLMATNVKADSLFSFGLDFEPTCPSDYKTYIVQDFRLEENTAENAFVTTLGMLAIIRVLTFLVVAWKIRTRQL